MEGWFIHSSQLTCAHKGSLCSTYYLQHAVSIFATPCGGFLKWLEYSLAVTSLIHIEVIILRNLLGQEKFIQMARKMTPLTKTRRLGEGWGGGTNRERERKTAQPQPASSTEMLAGGSDIWGWRGRDGWANGSGRLQIATCRIIVIVVVHGQTERTLWDQEALPETAWKFPSTWGARGTRGRVWGVVWSAACKLVWKHKAKVW